MNKYNNLLNWALTNYLVVYLVLFIHAILYFLYIYTYNIDIDLWLFDMLIFSTLAYIIFALCIMICYYVIFKFIWKWNFLSKIELFIVVSVTYFLLFIFSSEPFLKTIKLSHEYLYKSIIFFGDWLILVYYIFIFLILALFARTRN